MSGNIPHDKLSGMSDKELLNFGFKRIKKGGKNPYVIIKRISDEVTNKIDNQKNTMSPEDILLGFIRPKKGSKDISFLIAHFLEDILGNFLTKIDTKLLMTNEIEGIIKVLERFDYGYISTYLMQIPTRGIDKIPLQNSMHLTKSISNDDKAKLIYEVINEIHINLKQFLFNQK